MKSRNDLTEYLMLSLLGAWGLSCLVLAGVLAVRIVEAGEWPFLAIFLVPVAALVYVNR